MKALHKKILIISSLFFSFYFILELLIFKTPIRPIMLLGWMHLIAAFYLYAHWMQGRWRYLWSPIGAIFALSPLINIFYYNVYGRPLESSLVIAMLREPAFVFQTFSLFAVNNWPYAILFLGIFIFFSAFLARIIRFPELDNPWRWTNKWWMLIIFAALAFSQIKWSWENDKSMLFTRTLFPLALYALIAVFVSILINKKLKIHFKILGLSLVCFYIGFQYLFNTAYRPLKTELTSDALMSLSFTNAFFQISAYPSLKQTEKVNEKISQLPSLPSDAPNLVIFMHDSLRASSLWSYGYQRPTDKALESLIKKSFIFKKAYSPSNYTDTSVPAMFTGIGSEKHPDRVRENLRIWDYFHRDFYTYYVVTQNPHFGKLVDFYSSAGLKLLWSAYHDSGKVFNPDTVDDIESFKKLSEIFNTQKRHFGVWHTQATHFPYKQADGFIQWQPCSLEYKGWPETLTNCYDNSITYVSDFVKKLTDQLDLNNTIVIITSDHGEGFGEHGAYFHNQDLHNESVHIPLIIYLPEKIKNALPKEWLGNFTQNTEQTVGTVDLVPTVLDLYEKLYGVQFPVDRSLLSGQSLFKKQENRVVISTGCFMDYRCYSRDFALLSDDLSLIYLFKDTGTERLAYDHKDILQKNPLPNSPETEARINTIIDRASQIHYLPKFIKAGQ
jgi:glucan phosphoethanolaminetransferase (alkaline phosphatase superfamily)